jgi:site-specific recombinase XerC
MNDATLVAQFGRQSVTALTPPVAAAFVAAQEQFAASTFNRRYAALQSFVRWCQTQGWLADDPLHGVERRPQPRHGPRALDPDQVETTLRGIRDVRDHALFWLIYDGGLPAPRRWRSTSRTSTGVSAPSASRARATTVVRCSSHAASLAIWTIT